MNIQIPPPNTQEAIEVHPAVRFQWVKADSAFCVSLGNTQQTAIDAFFEANRAAMSLWPPQAPFYALQDLSSEKVGLSPYFRHKINAFIADLNASGLEGHIIFLFAPGLMGQVMDLGARLFITQAKRAHIHTHHQAAAAWGHLARLMAEGAGV
jgi:hypothetical protein